MLGPLLFTLYTTPLSSVTNRHHLGHDLNADDTLIYISDLLQMPIVPYNNLEIVLMTFLLDD